MIDEYIKARKMGEREYKARLAKGGYPFLPALDDLLPDNATMRTQALGLMEIPVSMIAGTKTMARQNSFAPGFMPLLDPDSEFATKWSNLYRAQMSEGFSDPIRVYEYRRRFYVQEGNKRVSVSRFLEMPMIMADVTRILPDDETLDSDPAYTEFLDFYSVCPLYDIECSQPGSYREIAELLGQNIPSGLGRTGRKIPEAEQWPVDLVKSLRASYWKFTAAYSELKDDLPLMAIGDAFLIYLRIYVKDALGTILEKEMDKRVRKIRKEFLTAGNADSVALVEPSDDAIPKPGGLLGKAGELIERTGAAISKTGDAVGKILTFNYTVKQPLRAAFIYNIDPDSSNWMYNHEVGRKLMERRYGGLVETEKFVTGGAGVSVSAKDGDASAEPHSSPEKTYPTFETAVEAAVKWGANVVFTTSVTQMDDTLRAAIKYDDVIFLNCSINLAHQAVRTYYAKLYEAKFLAGIVAGAAAAADGTHTIGYCSDYPIYGTIACINAFAIGAAMADPQVKIHLEWSAKQDSNWWWSMVDRGIHVISAVDSLHNIDGSQAYGVCYVTECEPGQGNDLSGRCLIRNLAAPIWKWGKLYEIIIKSILDGTYQLKLLDKKDQATNYWWGMISGVVDVELADDLSPYTLQLVNILRSDIISGSMNPFDGELRSQEGLVKHAYDTPLSSKDIITMNWLNENVIGEIPDHSTLTETGRETVKVSGVK
ncbi:MAG: BMP family ABC transporter substrate-binding protein [Mogibacterium sp.]|nr:BMP family ABC transporter substrate-binding protein [Mogibacterium sp.]